MCIYLCMWKAMNYIPFWPVGWTCEWSLGQMIGGSVLGWCVEHTTWCPNDWIYNVHWVGGIHRPWSYMFWTGLFAQTDISVKAALDASKRSFIELKVLQCADHRKNQSMKVVEKDI